STLLKILSKITPPTSGKIITRGRIASLLEVGTGFHPELTGRENIYLNGAILGLKKKEIDKHFDTIVAFSGVEKFIDTPLKRYSSGMQLRLAFAVAAHLEPEILIIDEVLAVGDAEFQKKCLGKMDEVSKSGRTVLFVSHNMGTINQLCQKCIILTNGTVFFHGQASEATNLYLQLNSNNGSEFLMAKDPEREDTNYISSIKTTDSQSHISNSFGTSEVFCIDVQLYIANYVPGTEIAIAIYNKSLIRILTIHELVPNSSNHIHNMKVVLESNQLVSGLYSITVALHVPHQICFHLLENILYFSITDTGTNLSDYENQDIGIFYPRYYVVK
ncbi:MAG TPA: ABC transporter ATP-binding protein, partial [Cytophagales bacterium]|nr:ABC transporter ATP-binding protein [Cytophagales bacterium]